MTFLFKKKQMSYFWHRRLRCINFLNFYDTPFYVVLVWLDFDIVVNVGMNIKQNERKTAYFTFLSKIISLVTYDKHHHGWIVLFIF